MRQNHRPRSLAIAGAVGAVAALLALSMGPAQAVTAATTTWRTDGFGPGNTGYNPAETTITSDTVNGLSYRWSIVSPVVRDSCGQQSPPVVSNGKLYLTDQGGIAAYNAATGATLWSRRSSSPAEESTPRLTVLGSRLLAASNYCQSTSDPDGTLKALDANTGDVLWTVRRDAPVTVLVVDGDIVVVSGQDVFDPAVTAYRLSDGAQVWTRPALLPRPVSANGRLLVNPYNADTGAMTGSELIDIRTGEVVWNTPTTWYVLAAGPAGGPLYAAGTAGELVQINVATGATVWSVPDAAAQLAVDDSRLYVTHGNDLVARETATGRQLWSRSYDSQLGKPVVAGGVVYATVSGRAVYPLNAATGADLDSGAESLYQNAVGHPIVVNGMLYVTTGRVLDAYGR